MTMKKIICLAVALVAALGVILTGCAPAYDKSPDQFSKIRWVAPDYSFRFNPSDDCKGNYNFNDKRYNIKVEFHNSSLSVKDTDQNKELFFADWKYEDGDKLFVYNITFNTKDYKDFETNYAEFVRLHQEKL